MQGQSSPFGGPATSLELRYTGKPVSGWGGLVAVMRYLERRGVRRVLASALPDGRTSPNQIPVVDMLLAFFARVNLTGAKLYINSIGDKNCRPAYVERLRGELHKVRDKLGADSQRRIETNPLRVLDSKLPEEQAIIDTLPHIADHLCDACREHYTELKRQLALRNIPYEENWRLVRGLDYYMRTTFEITAPGLGSQNAVCGGGRYDGLVELLGGPATTKGIGFAIGTDRLMLSLQEAGAEYHPLRPGLQRETQIGGLGGIVVNIVFTVAHTKME